MFIHALRSFFQWLNICQNNKKKMLPEQTDNYGKAKNNLHVLIGSVSNTKTEKCQQKLAVILCRIKWKNIDMQTNISHSDTTREIG